MSNLGFQTTDPVGSKGFTRFMQALKQRAEVNGMRPIPHEADNYTCPATGLRVSVKQFGGSVSVVMEVSESETLMV